jgi:hypothetical protein
MSGKIWLAGRGRTGTSEHNAAGDTYRKRTHITTAAICPGSHTDSKQNGTPVSQAQHQPASLQPRKYIPPDVHLRAVAVAAQDLGRHVAGCAAGGLLGQQVRDALGKAEVRYFNIRVIRFCSRRGEMSDRAASNGKLDPRAPNPRR